MIARKAVLGCILNLFFCAAFAQTSGEDFYIFPTQEETRFSMLEEKGDSCLLKNNVTEAKKYFNQALEIKEICRVRQKVNELNKIPAKTCPDFKTYSELFKAIDYYRGTDTAYIDSLTEKAMRLEEELTYGIPQYIFKKKLNTRSESAAMQAVTDSLIAAITLEMERLMDSMGVSMMDTAATIGMYEPEKLGDEKFKNKEFEDAKYYFQQAQNDNPSDKVLKKKIEACDREIKKKKKRKK
jgi:hypothetical protein